MFKERLRLAAYLFQTYNPHTFEDQCSSLTVSLNMSDNIKDNKKGALSTQSKITSTETFRNFFSNDYHTFLVQKSERLASALHIITGFIPSEEPVRLKLRTCALDLISSAADRGRLAGAGIDQFASQCAEIGTFLETALSAGLISHMNARLVCDEYASLAQFARENRTNITGAASFNKDGIQTPFSAQSPLEKNQSPKVHVSTQKRVVHGGTPKKRQSDRRTAIIDLFKNRNAISIKDAAASIVGCSEKTIQRELLSLVQEGILVKEGDRRWTTYRKVSS